MPPRLHLVSDRARPTVAAPTPATPTIGIAAAAVALAAAAPAAAPAAAVTLDGSPGRAERERERARRMHPARGTRAADAIAPRRLSAIRAVPGSAARAIAPSPGGPRSGAACTNARTGGRGGATGPARASRGRCLLRSLRRFGAEERGAVTAEYAIVILAAVAFAGLLVAILQSAEIRAMLVGLVEQALGTSE